MAFLLNFIGHIEEVMEILVVLIANVGYVAYFDVWLWLELNSMRMTGMILPW